MADLPENSLELSYDMVQFPANFTWVIGNDPGDILRTTVTLCPAIERWCETHLHAGWSLATDYRPRQPDVSFTGPVRALFLRVILRFEHPADWLLFRLRWL